VPIGDPPRTYKSGESFEFDWKAVLEGPIYTPRPSSARKPHVIVIASTIEEVVGIAMRLGIANNDETVFVLVGSPVFTGFAKAYASLDLAPEVRTPEEDRWFESQLGRRAAVVTYVDFG
jgi:hypothetical protein